MATTLRKRQRTVDVLTYLTNPDGTEQSETATATMANGIIDMGAAQAGHWSGTAGPQIHNAELVVDISAIEVATDEVYVFAIQGSDSASFASGVEELCALRVGEAATMGNSGDVDSDVGRYTIPFSNERNGRAYRYIRGAVIISGTISTGIDFRSYLTK